MICLGIESSCDETAIAIVKDGQLLDSVLATQIHMHALFGGVVPELASREHYRYMGPLYDEILYKTKLNPQDIDYYAVSHGPGLLGALLVGVSFAKGLSFASGKPILGINHLHAHLLAAGLEQELVFPALGLLVSGGHTHLYKINSAFDFQVLGKTLDDAAGEAFDKVGKILGLDYPAGRAFDTLSQRGQVITNSSGKNIFPTPYLDNDNLDFSFSGLKTAASQYITKNPHLNLSLIRQKNSDDFLIDHDFVSDKEINQDICDLCASFTQAVVKTLCLKSIRALKQHSEIKNIILAGGVASNSHLRHEMKAVAKQFGKKITIPSPALCTDNAAMIAYTGYLYAKQGVVHPLDFASFARGQTITNL